MSLKIQIVSDVHVEFWANKKTFNFIVPSAPILALLGDICCVGSDDDFQLYKRFIMEYLPKFQHIILVAGNHEYYYQPSKRGVLPKKNNTIDGCNKKLLNFCKQSPKLHFLNNGSMTLTINKKNYLIIGTTLWSYIPSDQYIQLQSAMNDYKFIYVYDQHLKQIRHLKAKDVVNMHHTAVRYIKSQLTRAQKNKMQLVVLTHHKPYLSKNYKYNLFSCAYESNLIELFHSPLILWGYGHTHIRDNSTINKIRVISNPKGYPYQPTGFRSSAIVEI